MPTPTVQYTTTVVNSYLTVVRDDSPFPFAAQVYSPQLMELFRSKAQWMGVDTTQLVRAVENAAAERGVSVQSLLSDTMGWL